MTAMKYLYVTCFFECKMNIESTERKTAFQNLYKPKSHVPGHPPYTITTSSFFPENFKSSIIILGTCNSVYLITTVSVFLILVT